MVFAEEIPCDRDVEIDKDDDNSECDGVFPIPNFGTDVGDIPDCKAFVTEWDIFWIVFSIITHLVDLGTDLNLAWQYFRKENYGYFIWTSAFLFLPSFINIIVSIRMYQQDYEQKPGTKLPTLTSRAVQQKFCCPFILIFQLAPVLRYMDCLKYACRSFQCRKDGNRDGQKKYYLKMLKEEQDISLLRVFECFLEAAPHQVLQLTLMMYDYNDDRKVNFHFIHQAISILSSLGSMGWAMSSYHRNIRLAQWDKENISLIGTWIQFLWHFCVTVSRIVAISAAAAIVSVPTAIVCFIHWFVMTIWIISKPLGVIQFCRDQSRPPQTPLKIHERIGAYLFASVFGVVYVFTYLKPNEGSTFYKHIFYYSICAIENIIACILWTYVEYEKVHSLWYYELVICLCTVPFILGVLFMIVYYRFFHPSLKKGSVDSDVPVST
ncbi:hypothetical protein PV327_008890 [Microctonus hyperodae]|uniref:XK-related protein n=1 Tax=Microctonus hyperodae TaxID=165561 RepID=A0AA39FSN0_MICHY|nr:hypothetical protein PV327_008890 [Microctonus hyperodae]